MKKGLIVKQLIVTISFANLIVALLGLRLL